MNKKLLNRILIFGVVLIWGVISVQIIKAILKKHEDKIKLDEPVIENNYSTKPPYGMDSISTALQVLLRDPFEFNKPVVKQEPLPIDHREVDRKPAGIMFKVGGIVINENRRSVLIEDLTNKKTVFLRVNERYLNLKIIALKYDSAVIDDNTTTAEYKLNR